jgi:hypothetical protein
MIYSLHFVIIPLLDNGGELMKMNLNEECLLQYLSNIDNSQSFVMDLGLGSDIFDCPEYNEVAWLFI